MIGADISTTLVAQVLSMDLSWLSPLLIIVGVTFYLTNNQKGLRRHAGRIIIGLGLMLLSLSLIREAATPLKESDLLPLIIGRLSHDPPFAILISALLTWVMHSSLASVLLFASLASSGIIDLELGILLVLGANMGGSVIPFAATFKEGASARQITSGNMLMRLIFVVLSFIILPYWHDFINTTSTNTAHQLINFHTAFNIGLAILFMPFISPLASLCQKLAPESSDNENNDKPQYLDEQALDSPAMALACAARETLRIAELVERMLINTIRAIKTEDRALVIGIKQTDDLVDTLYNATKIYLTRLTEEEFDTKEADRYIQILTFSTNLEHIGDIIDKSLMDIAEKKIKRQENFSEEGLTEIQDFHDRVLDNLRLAQAIFMSEDRSLAAQLVGEKSTIREAAQKTSDKHFRRLQEGKSESLATSSLHLDIIRDYRRINSYATRLAYSILESKKEQPNG